MKILGFVGEHRSYAQTAERFIPWIRWAFVVLLVSGSLLIVGEPIRELPNPIFWVKMILILVTVPISFAFNMKVAKATASGALSGSYKLGAVLLIVLWCAIMFGGRWIAYAPV